LQISPRGADEKGMTCSGVDAVEVPGS
jgi:hypothetical protein